MYYLRIEDIENNIFGFAIEGIHEILKNDIAITEEEYNRYFELLNKGKQFRIANLNATKLFEIIEEYVKEIEIIKTPIDILKEENESLRQMDKSLISTNWDMDYRLCEIEWFLEDITINTKSIDMFNNMKEVNVMAGLSRYEQAKIIILGGEYDDKTLRRQLQTHFNRGNLTQDEYDELISLMDARELVQGE